MRTRIWVLLIIGFCTAFVQPAKAEDFAPGTTVRHVNYAKKEVTLEIYRRKEGEREVKVYKMDMAATITLNGENVKLDKIHKGQHVTGIIESDPGTIVTLTVQSYK